MPWMFSQRILSVGEKKRWKTEIRWGRYFCVSSRYLFKAYLLCTTVNPRWNIPSPLVQLIWALNSIVGKIDLWPESKTSIHSQLFPLILLYSVSALSSRLCLECFRKEFLVWVKKSSGRLKSGGVAISVFPCTISSVYLRGNIPSPLVQLAKAVNRIAKNLICD